MLDIGGETLPLPTGDYDVVSAMDMLFHILDEDAYRRAIANLGALVRPGGHVVLTENLLDGRVEKAPAQTSRARRRSWGCCARPGLSR